MKYTCFKLEDYYDGIFLSGLCMDEDDVVYYFLLSNEDGDEYSIYEPIKVSYENAIEAYLNSEPVDVVMYSEIDFSQCKGF